MVYPPPCGLLIFFKTGFVVFNYLFAICGGKSEPGRVYDGLLLVYVCMHITHLVAFIFIHALFGCIDAHVSSFMIYVINANGVRAKLLCI